MGAADFMIGPPSEQVKQLETLARAEKETWFTHENITRIILNGTAEQKRQLNRADALYRNIELSLRFNQARRAAKYVAGYRVLCRQIFSRE